MAHIYPAARAEIRASGISFAAYCRYFWADGKWHGDKCGCSDDRCIGFHHEAGEECGCLPVLLDQVAAAVTA